MTGKKADFVLLRKEIEAFIHIMEVLARCKHQSQMHIDLDSIQRMARVLNLHILNTVSELYDTDKL